MAAYPNNPHIDLSAVDITLLAEEDVELKRVAATHNGEYAGPCPFCRDGEDRFRVWPQHPDGKGLYWCRQCERTGDAIQYLRERDQLSYMDAVDALRQRYPAASIAPLSQPPRPRTKRQKKAQAAARRAPRKQEKKPPAKEIARYIYKDAEGQLLYQVRRMERYAEDGTRLEKAFPQYRYEKGKWLPGLKDVRRVLYRLPQIIETVRAEREVYLVEGEKSVEALVALGFDATCNPMGARKWDDAYSETLKDAKVIILPDMDRDGLAHAELVAGALSKVALWVKVVHLPGLEVVDKGGPDIVDWLEISGHGPTRLKRVSAGAPLWTPGQAPHNPTDSSGKKSAPSSEAKTRPKARAAPDKQQKGAANKTIAVNETAHEAAGHTSKMTAGDKKVGSPAAGGPDCPGIPNGIIRATHEGHEWLDIYITCVERISPMSPRLLHESVGLWLASVSVA